MTSPYFTTNLISLDKTLGKDYSELDSFVIYVCVAGSVTLVHDGTTEPQIALSQGEAVLIPAGINRVDIIPSSPSEILEVYIA